MKIAFDLDGVLRDINLPLVKRIGVPYPKTWVWKYKDGEIFDYFVWMKKDNYQTLLTAPPTEYLTIFKELCSPYELWTAQPEEWKPNTLKWINRYIGNNVNILFLTTEEKGNRLDKYTDYILVEDNPNFSSYERIILIDRPYNQNVNAERVKTANQLTDKLLAKGCIQIERI